MKSMLHVMKTRGRKIRDRFLASLGGGVILCLDAFPLGVSMVFLCNVLADDSPKKVRLVAFAVISILLFGAIAFVAVRNIVRVWRDLSVMEKLQDSMTPAEGDEFRNVVASSEDVEILVGKDGRRHFVSSED